MSRLQPGSAKMHILPRFAMKEKKIEAPSLSGSDKTESQKMRRFQLTAPTFGDEIALARRRPQSGSAKRRGNVLRRAPLQF